MNRLTSYLLRALVQALLFVTLAVTAAVWLTQALRYVDIVVENGAPLHMFVWLALLTLPTFLGITLPVALFVAVLFTYHRLTQDSELIAMRACGLGPRALLRPALILAVFTTGLSFFISLYVQPLANQELIRLQYFVQSQFSAALLKEGTFNDLGNRMTVYVARRERNAELFDLLIHDGRNPEKPVTIRARHGQLVQGATGPQVIVYDGIQQEYNRAQHRLSELRFDSYAVNLDSLVPTLVDRAPLPRERSTLAVWQGIDGDVEVPMRGRLRAELHQRLSTPFLAIGFTLIAGCCLVFGELNRRGQAWRVVLAIVLAAGVQAAILGLGQIVSRAPLAVLPLYVSLFLPIIAGFLLLWKAEREGRAVI